MFSDQWFWVLQGDREAFLNFYQDCYQTLFSYGFRLCGNRELTKDCLQELFLELWKSRHSLNPTVKNSSSYLMTWLRRIISRRILADSHSSTTDQNRQDAPAQPSYEELLISFQTDEEKKKKLAAALLQLSPSQLRMIRQRFFENKSIQEIADEGNISKQTVYNTVHKALIILRQAFGEFGSVFLPLAAPVSILMSAHQPG